MNYIYLNFFSVGERDGPRLAPPWPHPAVLWPGNDHGGWHAEERRHGGREEEQLIIETHSKRVTRVCLSSFFSSTACTFGPRKGLLAWFDWLVLDLRPPQFLVSVATPPAGQPAFFYSQNKSINNLQFSCM